MCGLAGVHMGGERGGGGDCEQVMQCLVGRWWLSLLHWCMAGVVGATLVIISGGWIKVSGRCKKTNSDLPHSRHACACAV